MICGIFEGESLILIGNFTDQTVTATFDRGFGYSVPLLQADAVQDGTDRFTLRKHGYIVF